MNYDFATRHDRRYTGSFKWDQVQSFDPPLPEDTISMSVADMDFTLAPEIAKAIQEYTHDAIPGYTKIWDGYYEAVCRWFTSYWNWDVEPGWIIPTNGVVPDLYHAVEILTRPRDGVIMFTPTYHPFYSAVREQGRKVAGINLIEDKGIYTIDWDAFEEAAADPNNTVLMFCNPHNPTGRVWSREELERVGGICQEHDLLIISDDIHADLIAPGHTHTAIASLSEELADRTVTLTAPSKTFNLAAFKSSNIVVSNPRFYRLFNDYRQQARIGDPPVTSLVAAEAAYRDGRPWLEELLSVINANDRYIRDAFKRFAPQVTISPREGTYLLWMDLSKVEADPEKQFKLITREGRVLPNSGRIFGETGAGWIRINLATCPETIHEAVRRLENVITAYKAVL